MSKILFVLILLAATPLLAGRGEVILEKGDYYVIDTGLGCSEGAKQ